MNGLIQEASFRVNRIPLYNFPFWAIALSSHNTFWKTDVPYFKVASKVELLSNLARLAVRLNGTSTL